MSLVKSSYEFFLFYNKIVIREGVLGLVWAVLVPIIIFISLNINWFDHKQTITEALPFLCAFWAYITVNTFLFGVAFRIIIFRENGFLRCFTYIGGSKAPIILGLLFLQIVHGLINIAFFTSVVSSVFGYPLFLLVEIATVTFLVVSIPLIGLMLSLTTLSLQTSTLYSIANMFMLPAMFIALYRGTISNGFLEFIFRLTPVEFVYNTALNISDIMLVQSNGYTLFGLLSVSLIYLICGIFSWKRIKLISVTTRT
ncbi:ABC transporter [Brevibacillus daliensis]|uniref:ABC transporter n=1 Tax=Brevibacillus daliensis TaxID=2892995 RepID=UPI001E2C0508|nr:ABC transporter [Brevibacillus daliensis]